MRAKRKMTAADSSARKRSREAASTIPEADGTAAVAAQVIVDDDVDLGLSSDIKGIVSALEHLRQKAKSDELRRNEEIINSVARELKCLVDESKAKAEKERQNFIKTATKACKECEVSLKEEAAKFQALYEKFCKDKNLHIQTYEEIYARFEDSKEKLILRYDQQKKKDKASLMDLQFNCAEKLAVAEEMVKKKKQEANSLNILRKTIGSFLKNSSDDDLE
ncbi:hypothetical protein O6H91_01G128300 [Diphasiastrum complanatum]|uniref:Uncharacterized protein n=1 Tax=Diphasiastrum complanatum TaxID=34168 RepID=A0ACC2EVX4_DIPCM|nr:hypothetical protein O6H91_Y550200 [Diphasiastrum complanatum]KAJ7570616.1 hypothetical protein O6H91_01G128300 [Diphasiastrum complanatum]